MVEQSYSKITVFYYYFQVHLKRGTMKRVGRVMLKGDNITLIQSMDGKSSQSAGGSAAN